ncbi:unnamed protein product [Ceratitis capitata]|uniref:(Mediterranean fruit fly) hypothetical protein n=1 Tax=Ceratitis capitata TaxID=7213 RepID=A0A811V123_CERCA|nr:unnamed protein product [Ceratitis capitata]
MKYLLQYSSPATTFRVQSQGKSHLLHSTATTTTTIHSTRTISAEPSNEHQYCNKSSSNNNACKIVFLIASNNNKSKSELQTRQVVVIAIVATKKQTQKEATTLKDNNQAFCDFEKLLQQQPLTILVVRCSSDDYAPSAAGCWLLPLGSLWSCVGSRAFHRASNDIDAALEEQGVEAAE